MDNNILITVGVVAIFATGMIVGVVLGFVLGYIRAARETLRG